MDVSSLKFRAAVIRGIRDFFWQAGFLELDTPLLADALIPETCLEVFQTEYVHPFHTEKNKTLFLVPSPEVYMKPIIAEHKCSVFQVSKCFRNSESVGRIHAPEFTMLEYYAVNADYQEALTLTEQLFAYLVESLQETELFDVRTGEYFLQPFLRLTMDDAFKKYAGFYLSDARTVPLLANHAERLGLGDARQFLEESWDDLYERIFVHAVEPSLPKDKLVALLDYPAAAVCLAKEHTATRNMFPVKERWELYAGGVELANCYTEETNAAAVDAYVEYEHAAKQKTARVPHPAVKNFGAVCAAMPLCTGTALGVDRLVMLLAGKSGLKT